MTATTATVHEPWCTDHTAALDRGHPGWCGLSRWLPRNETETTVDVVACSATGPCDDVVHVELSARGRPDITSQEARQVAAWLVEAADMVDRLNHERRATR